MLGARRTAAITAGVALVWFVVVLVLWAFRPLDDSVPVGIDYTADPPAAVSSSVDCNTLFDSAPRDSSQLPALKAQPANKPSLAYQRQPCVLVQRQARLVFGFAAAVFLAIELGAGWLLLWRPRALRRAAESRVGIA